MKPDGVVAAWQALNRSVAADLKANRGEIKAARVIEKKANPKKLSLKPLRSVVLSFGRML